MQKPVRESRISANPTNPAGIARISTCTDATAAPTSPHGIATHMGTDRRKSSALFGGGHTRPLGKALSPHRKTISGAMAKPSVADVW